MFSSVVPQRWRGPIVYVLMSVFVTWHAICLIVGPAPQTSVIAKALRPLVSSYLDLISLNVKWGFFAPIGGASEFRYLVLDNTGKVHTFWPASGLAWYHPSELWVTDRYRTIVQNPDIYGDHLIAGYCRKHTALNPVEIKLQEVAQVEDLLPPDHLAGKHPLDRGFAATETLRTKKCSRP